MFRISGGLKGLQDTMCYNKIVRISFATCDLVNIFPPIRSRCLNDMTAHLKQPSSFFLLLYSKFLHINTT